MQRARSCRLALVPLLLAGLSLGAAPDRFRFVDPEMTRRPDLERRLRSVAEALGGEAAPCKRSLITLASFHAVCIDATESMRRQPESLTQMVQKQMEQLAKVETVGDGWESSRSVSRARFSESLQVAVHHKSAHVILAYPPSGTACLPNAAREGAVDLELAPPVGEFERPVVVHKVNPDYPVAARIERLGAYVLMGFRIEASGEVSVVCVADTNDQSDGFFMAHSAVEAVLATVYSPAKLDGEKVAVTGSMIMTFTLNGGNNHQSLSRR